MEMNETVLNNVILDLVGSTSVPFGIDSLAWIKVGGSLTSIFGGGNTVQIVNATWTAAVQLSADFGGIQLILDLNQSM